MAFNRDGRRLASAGRGTVKLWDTTTWDQVATLDGAGDRVEFSADGKRLVTARADGIVRFFDAEPLQESLTFRAAEHLLDVSLSPDGNRVATTSYYEPTVQVRDAHTGAGLFALRGHESPVMKAAFRADSQHVATRFNGHESQNLARDRQRGVGEPSWPQWRGAADCTIERELVYGEKCIVFSPDGTLLASSAEVLDLQTGQPAWTIKQGSYSVNGIAFSPDGTRLATSSEDTTVKLWDVALGREILSLRANSQPFSCVTFSADGRRLAAGAGGSARPGEIVIWDAGASFRGMDHKGDVEKGD